MATFILGYDKPLDVGLTQYSSAGNADYNAEEWCAVKADTLKEAKNDYERQFLAWQRNSQIIK